MREARTAIPLLLALGLANAAPGQSCASPLEARVGDTPFQTSPGTLLSLTSAGASCDVASFGSNIIFNVAWMRFVPPSTGDFEISTCGLVPFDSRLAVLSECGNPASCIVGGDDAPACTLSTSATPWASRVLLQGATAGVPCFVAVGSMGTGVNGSGAVRIQPVGAQQDGLTCATAFVAADGTNFLSTSVASPDVLLPGGCNFPSGSTATVHRAAWFRWTATQSATMQVSTCGLVPFDSRIAVLRGGCRGLECLGCNDDAAGCQGFTSTLAFEAIAGEDYLLCIGGHSAVAFGSGSFTVAAGVPPGPSCGSASHACCEPSPAPFCSDADCCGLVCGEDPFCCSTDGAWDQVCADRATVLCTGCGAGNCSLAGTAASEGEPCGASTNAGCESSPPAFTPIAPGIAVSGTFWADADSRDVDWYQFTIKRASLVAVTLRSAGPGQLFLVDGACPPTVLDSTSAFAGACPAVLELCLLPGTYRVLAATSVFSGFPCGAGDGRNDYEILVEATACDAQPPPNDECAAAIPVDPLGASIPFDTRLASDSGPALPFACEEGNGLSIVRDVWYAWTPRAGTARVRTCGSAQPSLRGAQQEIDTRLAVYASCGGALVACNDDSPDCPGFGSSVTLQADGATAFLVRLGGFDSAGTGTVAFEVFDPVPNDECAGAIDIGTTGAADFVTEIATDSAPALPSPECNEGYGVAIRKDVWYRWIAPCTGTATATTCSTASFDTWLAAYADCGAAPLACNDDAPGCDALTSEIRFDVQAGLPYLVRVGGHDGAGSGTLALSCSDPTLPPPANDRCAGAIALPAGIGPVPFDTSRALSDEPSAPSGGCAGTGIYKDVWFTFRPARGGDCVVSTCGGAAFDTRLEIWDGCPDAGGTVVACNDDSCGAQSSVRANLLCDRTYLVRVAGYGPGSAGVGAVSATEGIVDCSVPCPEDLDGDGLVDGADLGRILLGWGSPGSSDQNGDGTTDGADLALVLSAWGRCRGQP